MVTTIQLSNEIKNKLDSLKIHRETYNDLLSRILDYFPNEILDKESLIETIDILSDPELMKGIKEALNEEKIGIKGTSIEDLKKELKID